MEKVSSVQQDLIGIVNRWRTSTRIEDIDNYVISVLQVHLGGWFLHLRMQAKAHEIPAPGCMELQPSASEYWYDLLCFCIMIMEFLVSLWQHQYTNGHNYVYMYICFLTTKSARYRVIFTRQVELNWELPQNQRIHSWKTRQIACIASGLQCCVHEKVSL